MRQHVDFLVVETDILESAKIEDGHVFVADIAAPIVLVPPMRVVEAPLQRWLDQYQRGGESQSAAHGRVAPIAAR